MPLFQTGVFQFHQRRTVVYRINGRVCGSESNCNRISDVHGTARLGKLIVDIIEEIIEEIIARHCTSKKEESCQ